MANPVKSLRTE